jgi:hypothetical protein
VTSSEGFSVRTGHESAAELPLDRHRGREVAQAWESLLRIRRLAQPERAEVPAAWERAQPLRAVSLALEAAGVAFCSVEQDAVVTSGVQLRQEGRGQVRVVWRYRRGHRPPDNGEADLAAAARALGEAGWDALLYRAGRERYLLVAAAGA